MVSQEKLNRLFWHSRRGMLELDLILVPFVKEHYASLTSDDQAIYDRFITNEDQDLFAWLMRRDVPDDREFAHIVTVILNALAKNTV